MILVKAPYSKTFTEWPNMSWEECKEEIKKRMSEKSTVNVVGVGWEIIEVSDSPKRTLTMTHRIVENESRVD